MTFWNSAGSMTSKISSSSFKNITSLGECVFGQNFSRFLITGSVNDGSFSKNWTTQYASCGWYTDNDLALCKGNRTFNKNTLCSSFNGRAKPFIILRKRKIKISMNTVYTSAHHILIKVTITFLRFQAVLRCHCDAPSRI